MSVLLAAALLAAAAASAAQATVRPLRSSDARLLRRAPTFEEQIAAQVAARLTRLHPQVRCGALGISATGVTGITLFDAKGAGEYFLMLPAMCDALAAFRASPSSYDPRACADAGCLERVRDAAMALATVSHESYHLLGYHNEAQVECYGMQSIWFVASKLGAPLDLAQSLAQFYATRMYPLRRTQTPAYWSAQCRDGGTLDLRRTLTRWPS
ncbi:MAG TPA: hypothetical protein VFA56_01375 [Gaiellaceae bacterium]|nr:hypothetical protein [Gaiellaceae bacterium]